VVASQRNRGTLKETEMKVTIKGIIHWQDSGYTPPQFRLWPQDMSSCGPEYVPIQPHEMEVEIPDDFDPRPKQVEILRQKKKEVLAAAQEKVNNLEEQIQRLLCIEFKPE
jgi:hypothetical protein